MSLWVWPLLLMTLGVGLIVLELFVPSGGVLGFLAAAAVLASIVTAYTTQGPMAGTMFLGFAVLGLPVLIATLLRWWPHTPLGRKILVQPPRFDDGLPSAASPLLALVGKRGRAKSLMLPSGVVTIEGRTYDALSEGMPIDPGQTVQVVQVRGGHLVVRLAEENVPETASTDTGDILSRPIDTLGLDPFEDPLA